MTDALLTNEAPRLGTAEFVAVALLALAAEAGVVLLALGFWPVPGAVYGAVAGHLGLTVLLALWLPWRHRRGLDLRLPGLLAVTTLFLGPMGPAATLGCALLFAVFSRYAMGFQDWYLSLFPESQVEPAQELYELIVSGREQAHLAAAESFTDVMAVGTPQQKQAVIALVARHFRPAFTPALKQGLSDADPSVRVQAATATARVEHEFNERWQSLDKAVAGNPQDVATRVALARHLDDYAFCGLLDANREAEVRQKALDGYRACVAMAPDDDEIRHDFGRLLLRLDLVEEAADTLESLVASASDRRLLVWYAESLFRLGRFADLRALCARRPEILGPDADLPDTLHAVMALWNGHAEAA
ncbi:MAG TPA: hypothetical protein VD860_08905 [Azospirillum sp.]|nr:hypothetical protein [Azospirillum sp.]